MDPTYHQHLRDRVIQTQAAWESAKGALSDFESFHSGSHKGSVVAATRTPAAAPTPAPTAAKATIKPATTTEGVVAKDGTPVLNKDGTPRKKPGPAKGTVPVKARATSSKKASEPAKAKVKATAKPGPKSTAVKGDKTVPSLINAIQLVMGNKTMNADAVYEALSAKGWLPNSNEPKGYIRYTLSSKKDIFLRIEGKRGFYHLDQTAKKGKTAKSEATVEAAAETIEAETETAAAPIEAKAAPKVEAPKVDDPMADVEDVLTRSGIDLGGSNPFAPPST